MPQPSNTTLRSVNISCEIIEELKASTGIGVTDLSERLDHSKSTIHDHLDTLQQNRIVVRKDQKYQLSIHLLGIAGHVRDQFGNYDVVRKGIDELAEEVGQNVQFGIEEHGEVYYYYKQQGAQGVDTVSRVGESQPMHSTSLGKTILAHLPEERVHAILDRHGMPAKTEHTITNRDDLFNELDEIAERGYAIDDEENLRGLRCVAAPVQSNEDVFGAVSVSGPSNRMSDETITDEIVDEVKSTANVIEINTRYG